MESADNHPEPSQNRDAQAWEGWRKRSMLRVLNQLDRMERTHQRLLQERERLGDPQWWKNRADLLQAHIHLLRRGMQDITLNDWTSGEPILFELDPASNPADNVQRYYLLYKKARRGLEVIGKRLPEVEKRLDLLRAVKESCVNAETPAEFKRAFERAFPAARPLPKTPDSAGEQRLPYRVFLSRSGHEIFVGKSGSDNDTLTFRVARPRDLWFHISGRSGAHVILRKRQKDEEIPESAQVDAAALAVYFSPARSSGEGLVTKTEVRHVRRMKGAPPGTVKVLQYSDMKMVLDRDSMQSLLQRRPAQDIDASLPPMLPGRVKKLLKDSPQDKS